MSLKEGAGGLGPLLEYLPRGSVVAINALLLAWGVGHHLGLSARPVEVQIGIEVLLLEALDTAGVRRGDVSIPHVLADHGSVLGLHPSVVVAVPRPRLGLLEQQLIQ